ncbi:MAG: hypothetical protein ISS36_02295 [Candidatus Aenigmarchaeota archaeon]|nr:hypothetical protein [Candidatus Aenigmarchaeota archaeon]
MTAQEPTEREDFYLLPEMQVWTPEGYRPCPRYIAKTKMTNPDGTVMVSKTFPEFDIEAEKQRARRPTSGEWHVIRRWAERECPELEQNMITGKYELTTTMADQDRDIVYQHPEHDEAGNLLVEPISMDRIGQNVLYVPDLRLKAKDAWKMKLPKESAYVKNLPDEFDMFLDTLYGEENAREDLPDYAFLSVFPNGLIAVLRGGWRWPARGGRVSVDAGCWPFGRAGGVSSRVVMDE